MRRTTGARSRRSCARRSRTGRSRCSATARRRARSATCRTSSTGSSARRVGCHHAGQHRQPGRVHAARARAGGDRGDRLAVGDRPRGAPHRRPEGPPARHLARARSARLGADRSSSERACAALSTNPASTPSPVSASPSCPRGWPPPSRRNLARVTPPRVAGSGVDLADATQTRAPAGRPAGVSICRWWTYAASGRRCSSFLLRMETLRRAPARVVAAGARLRRVFGAIFIALMVKAVLRDGDWAWSASWWRRARRSRSPTS